MEYIVLFFCTACMLLLKKVVCLPSKSEGIPGNNYYNPLRAEAQMKTPNLILNGTSDGVEINTKAHTENINKCTIKINDPRYVRIYDFSDRSYETPKSRRGFPDASFFAKNVDHLTTFSEKTNMDILFDDMKIQYELLKWFYKTNTSSGEKVQELKEGVEVDLNSISFNTEPVEYYWVDRFERYGKLSVNIFRVYKNYVAFKELITKSNGNNSSNEFDRHIADLLAFHDYISEWFYSGPVPSVPEHYQAKYGIGGWLYDGYFSLDRDEYKHVRFFKDFWTRTMVSDKSFEGRFSETIVDLVAECLYVGDVDSATAYVELFDHEELVNNIEYIVEKTVEKVTMATLKLIERVGRLNDSAKTKAYRYVYDKLEELGLVDTHRVLTLNVVVRNLLGKQGNGVAEGLSELLRLTESHVDRFLSSTVDVIPATRNGPPDLLEARRLLERSLLTRSILIDGYNFDRLVDQSYRTSRNVTTVCRIVYTFGVLEPSLVDGGFRRLLREIFKGGSEGMKDLVEFVSYVKRYGFQSGNVEANFPAAIRNLMWSGECGLRNVGYEGYLYVTEPHFSNEDEQNAGPGNRFLDVKNATHVLNSTFRWAFTAVEESSEFLITNIQHRTYISKGARVDGASHTVRFDPSKYDTSEMTRWRLEPVDENYTRFAITTDGDSADGRPLYLDVADAREDKGDAAGKVLLTRKNEATSSAIWELVFELPNENELAGGTKKSFKTEDTMSSNVRDMFIEVRLEFKRLASVVLHSLQTVRRISRDQNVDTLARNIDDTIEFLGGCMKRDDHQFTLNLVEYLRDILMESLLSVGSEPILMEEHRLLHKNRSVYCGTAKSFNSLTKDLKMNNRILLRLAKIVDRAENNSSDDFTIHDSVNGTTNNSVDHSETEVASPKQIETSDCPSAIQELDRWSDAKDGENDVEVALIERIAGSIVQSNTDVAVVYFMLLQNDTFIFDVLNTTLAKFVGNQTYATQLLDFVYKAVGVNEVVECFTILFDYVSSGRSARTGALDDYDIVVLDIAVQEFKERLRHSTEELNIDEQHIERLLELEYRIGNISDYVIKNWVAENEPESLNPENDPNWGDKKFTKVFSLSLSPRSRLYFIRKATDFIYEERGGAIDPEATAHTVLSITKVRSHREAFFDETMLRLMSNADKRCQDILDFAKYVHEVHKYLPGYHSGYVRNVLDIIPSYLKDSFNFKKCRIDNIRLRTSLYVSKPYFINKEHRNGTRTRVNTFTAEIDRRVNASIFVWSFEYVHQTKRFRVKNIHDRYLSLGKENVKGDILRLEYNSDDGKGVITEWELDLVRNTADYDGIFTISATAADGMQMYLFADDKLKNEDYGYSVYLSSTEGDSPAAFWAIKCDSRFYA